MIGVLSVAPWHFSIGDLATAEVTTAHLVDAGLPARQVSSATEGRPTHLVIGGGDLFGRAGRWAEVKRGFEVPGPHVLNAVGVDPASIPMIDWSFTAEHRLVTVRDEVVADLLRDRVGSVRAVPCPATLVEPYAWDQLLGLPGHGELQGLEPGGYVAVHRHPDLLPAARQVGRAAGLPVVAVDVQPHAHHGWTRRGVALRTTHSPRVIATVVANARFVLSGSLHLAVFALGQGTAFAAHRKDDYQADKIRRYLARAGVEEAFTTDRRRLLAVAEDVERRMAAVTAAERAASLAHIGAVIDAVSPLTPR